MTPTRTRADNFVRHQIERFRGNDIAWALYCKRRKGVREMIDKLEIEFDLVQNPLATAAGELAWYGKESKLGCIGPIVHREESGFDHMPLMTDAEMYPDGMPDPLE